MSSIELPETDYGNGGMRHRKKTSSDAPGSPGFSKETLKKFDVYSKIHDDHTIKTASGGSISLGVYFLLACLLLAQLNSYLTPELTDQIVVDSTLNEKLPIGMNVTFSDLRCSEVSVDTVDSAGDNQINIQGGGLVKYPVDARGFIMKAFEISKKMNK